MGREPENPKDRMERPCCAHLTEAQNGLIGVTQGEPTKKRSAQDAHARIPSLLCFRLKGYASRLTAGFGVRRANADLACGAVMLTVMEGAVLDIAANALNVLRLILNAVAIHLFHFPSSPFREMALFFAIPIIIMRMHMPLIFLHF